MNYLFLLVAYLLGSIPTGVWYSHWKHKVDVRDLGSGNSGATNVGRNFGIKAAIGVTLVDILKGALAVVLASLLFPGQDFIIMGAALAAVIGHAYPVLAHFKGGKVVATSFGVLAGYNVGIAFVFALLLFLFIYLTSIISLSAMASYTSAALYVLLSQPLVYGLGFALIALFMIYRHRQNVDRLIKGTESRISWGLRNPKKSQENQ